MDMYAMPTTGFEQSLYADASYNSMNQNPASPAFYTDEGEIRMPSSSLSTASASSSAIGSPQSNPGRSGQQQDWNAPYQPSIVGNDYISPEYTGYPMDDQSLPYDFSHSKGFVDPSLIHPEIGGPHISMAFDPFQRPVHSPHHLGHPHHQQQHNGYPASPSGSSSSPMLRHDSASPSFLQSSAPFNQTPFSNSPYATPVDPTQRRPSMGGFVSPTGESYSGDESKEKQRCTYPDCGKVFKDLKAHMLTHQTERPEKCPIQTCEYHTKGFARKYDKNRHTLTHYKGTMVCGFCPNSGLPDEKTFNRADVFKRHLLSVHHVEQTPPNSRKKTPTGFSTGKSKKPTGYAPDATGKCSTCSQSFANAQDFYEHLDDCVLRIVQQEDPAEAVNAAHLAEVEDDKAVLKTLARNKVSDETKPEPESVSDSDDDVEMVDEDDNPDPKVFGDKAAKPAGAQKSKGLTHSRGGVPLRTKAKDRKPKRYPSSWGDNAPRSQLMRKRVMACFDGPRRLVKDDYLMYLTQEVRTKLADGKHYVTDLDRRTIDRAEGFLNATDEEKGPWISDDPTMAQLKEMEEIQAMLSTDSLPAVTES